MVGPLGGTRAVDPGAPTINAKKHRRRTHLGGVGAGDLGVPTINAKKHQWWPPLGGAGAGDLGAPTINAKKRRRWAPWEVSELEIQERPPSTLRNINGGPPGRCRS
jgi:hypothetical protein